MYQGDFYKSFLLCKKKNMSFKEAVVVAGREALDGNKACFSGAIHYALFKKEQDRSVYFDVRL